MTRGPRRLMDDPDFKWETGCDLADEALNVGDYDLAGAKAQLLARIAAQPPVSVGDGVPAVRAGASWTTAIKPIVGVTVGAGLLAAAFWLGMQSQSVPAPAPPAPAVLERPAAPVEAPVPAPEPVIVPEVQPEVEPEVEPEAKDAVAAAPIAEPAPEPEPEVEPEPEPEPEPDAVAELDVEPEAPAPAPPTSSIAAQMEMYEPAADALQAGRYTAAVHGFRAYLDAWPDGDLRNEAELGLLQALFESGDARGTAELAQALQDRRALADRREDILRLRAESLLLLDRCDEALLVAEQLSARAAAPIRRGCRLKRRDNP